MNLPNIAKLADVAMGFFKRLLDEKQLFPSLLCINDAGSIAYMLDSSVCTFQ